jgi:hypothetical protein
MNNSVPVFVQVGGETHQIGTASVLGYDVILKLGDNDNCETVRRVISRGNVGGLTILPMPNRATPI